MAASLAEPGIKVEKTTANTARQIKEKVEQTMIKQDKVNNDIKNYYLEQNEKSDLKRRI